MSKQNRPKLDVPTTGVEIWLQRVAGLAIFFSFLLIASNYSKIPETIPIHFDIHGNPDGWGNKIILWVLPTILGIVVAFINWICHRPHEFNYPFEITEENAAYYYRKTRIGLRLLSVVIALMALYLTQKMIQIALGEANKLDPWFIWVFLSAIGISVLSMIFPLKVK